MVYSISYYFSALKINRFLTQFLPAHILSDSVVNDDILFQIYEIFQQLIQEFMNLEYISRNEGNSILSGIIKYNEIREKYWQKNAAEKTKFHNLEKDWKIWMESAIAIPPYEYELRLKNVLKIDGELSKLEWELAEAIRFNFVSNLKRDSKFIIHNPSHFLDICIAFADYTDEIIQEMNKRHIPFTALPEIWPFMIKFWGGSSFFWKNSLLFFPRDTIEIIFETISDFIFGQCKKCNFNCLHHFVPAMDKNVLSKNEMLI